MADWLGGWTCCVEQGNYGHRARKATWLYACRTQLPSLRWGRSRAATKLDAGFHSAEERKSAKARGWTEPERLTDRERAATPPAFRDLLLSIARGATARAA